MLSSFLSLFFTSLSRFKALISSILCLCCLICTLTIFSTCLSQYKMSRFPGASLNGHRLVPFAIKACSLCLVYVFVIIFIGNMPHSSYSNSWTCSYCHNLQVALRAMDLSYFLWNISQVCKKEDTSLCASNYRHEYCSWIWENLQIYAPLLFGTCGRSFSFG